ncbi:hypothetical protein [Sulfurimonas sp.]|uniref:hypothetical protein n=1 Tax=Sulfurimonas sp. TaxID=2022749 RepID=UPI00262F4627|nr:hypothetical protein [Sulfurimonas sp.]MDD5157880.1 hypothetical protein [Sulfurimonas sp.]
MKEIGGYFELELAQKEEYHFKAIKLNSGRNAFKYILKTQSIKKAYLPCFICDSIVEPLQELEIEYEFYNIDNNFEIVQKLDIKDNEKLFYINYFALKSEYIKRLTDMYSNKLIVDNTQAFFEKPIKNIDTIYSPRKFFGVSDGGYLYTSKTIADKLDVDESSEKTIQLLGRIDKNATSFYDDYQKAEQRLMNLPIKNMSRLTQKILSSIDYQTIQQKRKENFKYLHSELKSINLLEIDESLKFTPFVYTLLSGGEIYTSLKTKLIENKIYVAKYWNEVLGRKSTTEIEKDFVNNIIPLPIDQRYSLEDMKRIIETIKGNYLNV